MSSEPEKVRSSNNSDLKSKFDQLRDIFLKFSSRIPRKSTETARKYFLQLYEAGDAMFGAGYAYFRTENSVDYLDYMDLDTAHYLNGCLRELFISIDKIDFDK